MNDASHRYLTIPNALSAMRMALLVPLLFFFRAEMFVPTLLLFLVSAGSDALDGAIARRWNMQSEFGRILDPFADKVIFVTLIAVLSRNVLASLPVGVLIMLEVTLLVMGTATYLWPELQKVFLLGANIYGKIKTCCETLLVLMLIVRHFFPIPYAHAYFISLYAALFLSIAFALKSIVAHIHTKPLF